jgi:hypothetical protein
MGKPWIWLVILVVIVVIVVVKVSGTKGKKAEPPPPEGKTTTVPAIKYEAIATSMSQADDYGKGRLKADFRDQALKGIGWVTAVEAIEGAGLRVMITVKAPPAGGEPDVIAEVPKENVPQGAQLAAGQKVDYSGYISGITTDPKVVVYIGATTLTLLKK